MNGKVVRAENAQAPDSVAEECKLAVSEYVSPIDRNGTAARRKLCSNNLYVKAFPTPEWTEQDMRAAFEPFGELVSVCIAVDENQKSKQFGFVCFKRAEDAQKAQAHFASQSADESSAEVKLYVREAKTKQQRQAEMAMESYKFKKSMMMHNLIVRGQDSSCTQEEFEDYFSGFGEVKSVKMIPEARIGFVCFVNKESAKAVLNHPDHMLQGKKLTVAHCKPKEERHTEMEEKIDRQAYAKHKNQQTIGQHSEVLQLISALAMMFNQMPNKNGGGGGGGNPGGNRMGGRMSNNGNGYGGPQQSHQNAGQQNNGQRMQGPRQHGGHQQQQFMGQGGGQPQPHMMPQPLMMPPGQQQQMAQSNVANKYQEEIMRIFQQPAFMTSGEQVKKNMVGTHIFKYVTEMVTAEYAPKITGMIVDLPMADLNQSAMSHANLSAKVRAAVQLLIETNHLPQEKVAEIPIMKQAVTPGMPLPQMS